MSAEEDFNKTQILQCILWINFNIISSSSDALLPSPVKLAIKNRISRQQARGASYYHNQTTITSVFFLSSFSVLPYPHNASSVQSQPSKLLIPYPSIYLSVCLFVCYVDCSFPMPGSPAACLNHRKLMQTRPQWGHPLPYSVPLSVLLILPRHPFSTAAAFGGGGCVCK